MSAVGAKVRHAKNSGDFESIKSKAGKKLIAVMFHATWCGPCKAIGPVFDRLAKTYNRVVFVKVDVDVGKLFAQNSGVKAMPTFMFWGKGSKLETETIRGNEPQKLEATVKRLNDKYSPFAGAGYSLSGPSTSSGAAASGPSPAAPPRRHNPWANPNFAKKKLAEASKKPEPPKQQQKKTPARSGPASPWADPSFKPKNPETVPAPAPTPPSASTPDDDLAKAIAMSMDVDQPQPSGGDTDAEMTDSPANPNPANPNPTPGNDPRLLKGINSSIVAQLTAMDFPQVRAEKAVILSKAKNIDAALTWLIDHENDADVDEPLQVVGSGPAEPKSTKGKLWEPGAKTWDPNTRGAPLGMKPGDKYEDEEESYAQRAIAAARARKLYKEPEKKGPLTAEEVKRRKAERRANLETNKLTSVKASTLKRRADVKEAQEVQRQRAEQERQRLIRKRAKEKAADKARKKAVREKIKRQKEARKREQERQKALREKSGTS